MDGRERQIDEPKRFRKMSIHVSRNRPGQIKWDFITRPRRETANYTTPQASAKMMQTCWFWDRPNHQIAGFRLTKCQNAAKLGVWRVITSVGVGGVYQTPNRDHTYIIVYTNRYMICIDMSYDIPVYWFIDQCLPLQFPLNRTLIVFRKESANRSVAEEPLMLRLETNSSVFLLNLGWIHASRSKVKTWCRWRPGSTHRCVPAWVLGPFHGISLTMSQNSRPPRNPLVLFAKSTVLGWIFDHHLWVCKTEQRQIGHRAPALLLETTHSLMQLSQKMWPQRSTSKGFRGIWNQQQSLTDLKKWKSLSLFPNSQDNEGKMKIYISVHANKHLGF